MNIHPIVYLVDDDTAVRDSLTLLFETSGIDIQSYDSPKAFLSSYCPGKPSCLLLDVNMPDMTGPELQEELARRHLYLPIIFLTGYGDIPTTVRTMKAGAIDFLTKPIQGKQLLERVFAALQHEVQRHAQETSEQALCARLATLTPREMEVMSLAVAGSSNKEIARRLGISHRTVETHRTRIMEKTGATNLIELARICETCRNPNVPKS